MNSDILRSGFEISLIGMAVVFLGLLMVTGAITAMRRLDERWREAERHAEANALQAAPTIDSTTLVLLAAAAATMIEGRHRIRGVRRMLPGESTASAWSITGRAVLQGSHTISNRPRAH